MLPSSWMTSTLLSFTLAVTLSMDAMPIRQKMDRMVMMATTRKMPTTVAHTYLKNCFIVVRYLICLFC